MSTQLVLARQGTVTPEMRAVAADERLDPEEIRRRIAEGTVVIPRNVNRPTRPVGIGRGLRTKVNANLGASALRGAAAEELAKLEAALEAGADAVMDLSSGADIDAIRAEVLRRSPVPVGTVPIYQVVAERMPGDFGEALFEVIERHAREGVDFMTVHCGVTRATVAALRRQGRLTGIVSRGGALLARWMAETGRENPLYDQFDRLCEIFRAHDVTFSLGDGLRPGAGGDATDRGQLAELLVLGELCERARAAGCQVMVEGPGHVPMDQIAANVAIEKRVTGGAPFYVLGPLVTDVAPGYDHITGAIGGAIAAAAGADFLCYVTPAEHLRLPTAADVVDGVIASRIAAHAADLAKGVPGAREWDLEMSRCRKRQDWEGMYRLAIHPPKARSYKESSEAAGETICTMCGSLCALSVDAEACAVAAKVAERQDSN